MKNINYDEEVNEWIKMAKEKEEEEWITSAELEEAMYDNFHYNLKAGFNIMSINPECSSSAIGTILLKCAQCTSDYKNVGTPPPCRCRCSLWYFMSEKRYKSPGKKVSQSK